jgi:hypothetical protein
VIKLLLPVGKIERLVIKGNDGVLNEEVVDVFDLRQIASLCNSNNNLLGSCLWPLLLSSN